ncbi:MAG: DUF1385 domain-containing protein [Anaerovoracaceae bacterium]|jgi:uncharacterized protein YqhQ
MDLSKIFLKDACPTSIGGQAVMEGIMMRGPKRTAICVRIPDGRLHIKTTQNGKPNRFLRLPLVRGVVSFVRSLVLGTKTLTYSADVLAYFMDDDEEEEEEPGRFEKWATEKFGEEKIWNFLVALSTILAIVFSIVVFVLLPTAAIGWMSAFIKNAVVLNLIEGLLRIALLILYIVLIAQMEDIKRVFEYHGAEHKTIHCFENGLELTPANAQQFYTLHPRCGTSFLMFVAVISLVLFSLFGWPSLFWRIVSRLLLLPVVAALSFELLRWAGRSNNKLVEILSMPGLLLQKLTTREPDDSMLEVAIAAMKAVMDPEDEPSIEGICDKDGQLIEPLVIKEKEKEKA